MAQSSRLLFGEADKFGRSVNGEAGRVTFLGEDALHRLVDGALGDDGVDGHGAGRVEPPDAVDELLVFVEGVGVGGQDEVRAIFEAVALAHGLESGDEGGVASFLEFGGELAACFGRDRAIQEQGGNARLGETGVQCLGKFGEGRADDDLLAAAEGFLHEGNAGGEFRGKFRP